MDTKNVELLYKSTYDKVVNNKDANEALVLIGICEACFVASNTNDVAAIMLWHERLCTALTLYAQLTGMVIEHEI